MYTQTLSTSLSTCFIVWLYVYLSVCLSVHPYSSEAQKAGAEQDNGWDAMLSKSKDKQ